MSEPTSAAEHALTDEDAQTYLNIGVTPRELVRLRWPDADDAFADFILWERTPYPMVSGVQGITDLIAALDDDEAGSAHDAEMAAARDADRVARVRVEGEAS